MSLPDLAPLIRQLKARKDSLQDRKWELEWQMKERKSELADITTVTRYVEDLRDLLSESSLAERKSFIKSFVKEVKVTGNNVLLTYTIPLPPKGLITEEMPVLSIVHSGGPKKTFAKPETFFELSIAPVSSLQRGQAYDHS